VGWDSETIVVLLHYVNPAGDAGDTSPNILDGGTSAGISPQYYYVLSDIADQYWLPSIRSGSSRFHSAIRRHQFASVRQADSRLTRLVPPNLELALTPLCCWHAGEDGQLLPLSCVYPLSRRSHDMPIVVVRSHEHDSTGSTVDTFLPQGDLTAAYEAIPLPTVHEDLSDD